MFGINLLNPFSLGDTIETSTILWLRILLLVAIFASSYIAYITPTKWIKYTMYAIIGISAFSFLWYLNTGSVFPGLGGSCVYCPSIGVTSKSLRSGTSTLTNLTTIQSMSNPFTSTHLYYFVIQDALGKDRGMSSDHDLGNSIVEWNDYYRLAMDRTTGMLYFRTMKQDPGQSVQIAKMPFGTLVQIAIIQNQKTFAICVNGERKMTIRSPSLPLSSCLNHTPVINRDGIISNGVLYHMEIHNTILDTPDLQRHRESVIAVYSNSSLFQNTPLPSSSTNPSLVERTGGYGRILSNQFSYPRVLATGLNSLQEQNG
jgi:hypothetical protein